MKYSTICTRVSSARAGSNDFANEDWQHGTNTAYLKKLVTYWIDGCDWRRQERAMNEYPQFRTEIDGVPIHFIHVRGKEPNPKPLATYRIGMAE